MRFHDLLNKPKKIKESKTPRLSQEKLYEKQLQEQLQRSLNEQRIKNAT